MTDKKWDAENIPNQNGKVVIVTGSSSGIGFEAARVLASKDAKVIIAVRNLEKGNAACERIQGEFKDTDLMVMKLDLANLESVKDFAETFRNEYSQLDLLINNAGVMVPPYSKTSDGFELQFGTNHLGHFVLTGWLLDLLINTEGSRIVNVSSGAHIYGKLDFDDLNWENRKYKKWSAYGDSKIANLYFTFELDRKLKENNLGTITTAAHPGWTATELQRNSGIAGFLNNFFAQDIPMGTLPTLRAAFDPDAKGGEYFGPKGFREMRGYPERVDSNDLSKDKKIAEKLWEVSETLTGVKFELGEKTQTAIG